MKVENTEKNPKFNLLSPDGTRAQVHSETISDVLLNDGHWYEIVPGSFKFYRTKPPAAGAPAVPFVQFDVALTEHYHPVGGKRVEVFPASVAGLAYVPQEDDK